MEIQNDINDEGVVLIDPSLELSIDEEDFLAIIGKKIDACEDYYTNTLKLKARRKVNEDFYKGNQLDESMMYEFERPAYKDNIIWQDEEKRIAMASARLPDIIVTPGNGEDPKKSQELAKKIEDGLKIRLDNDTSRRLIKNGLRLKDVYFTSAIKCRWDANKGESGDFVYEIVHPTVMGFDHTARIPDDGFTSDNMEVIYEWLEEPVGVVLAKFPGKKDDVYRALGWTGAKTRRMASKIKYLEIWFTWYDSAGKQIEGVAWRYKNILLGKSKHPYWDWSGVDKPEFDQAGVPTTGKTFKNYFDRPRKPYIFFTHISLGKDPIDTTTPIEQTISLQKIVNKRGQQITKIADNAIPKKVFGGKYITREEAEKCTNDPDENIYLDGEDIDDVNKAVGTLRSDPPNPILYNDMLNARGQIDSKFSTHGATRGEVANQNESGISKQITREGDLVDSDDIVGIVVERVYFEMASWALQMMKTMYDKEHYLRNMGKDGELIEVGLSSDKIEDGIAVSVRASTVDKVTQRNIALNLAARKAIDPLTMYEDLDVANPKERASRLVAFLAGAVDGYARYAQVTGLDVTGAEKVPPEGNGGQVTTPPGQPPQSIGMNAQQAALDIQRIQSGEVIEPQDVPSQEYVQVFMDFMQSPDFDALSPDIQQAFVEYIQKLKAMVAGDINHLETQGGAPPAPAPAPVPTPMPAPMGA